MSQTDIPGYKVGKRLGRGGMATVFLATQQPINRKVALKVMSNQLGEDSVWAKRFIQEAQVIAQLTHPNVVPVYDVGTHEGQFYISMELLDGGSLKSRMANGIPLPDVLKIIVGVAAGLDYAGEKGFVHRDIKPDNIMFREDGSPVILDFGIVKQMDDGGSSGMTQTGVIVGTTSYMSPEQAQGRELDQRSDIYALGIMFFELLTGRPPFKGETDIATLLMHVNDPVPTLPATFKVFQPIIEKALAKDPFHRYTRAREMIDHIQKLEPQIKQAIAKLKVGNASAPTLVKSKKDLMDDDATVVVSTSESNQHTCATAAITSEEELTQVLSSAKATIKDFSAESRDKRARRTRGLIATMFIVAIGALGYVGYQQLVVVPKEHAIAEEKIREAKLKTQRKIESLLAEAKPIKEGLLPTEIAKVDNLIAIYRQVLRLDSDNEEAQFTLERFGERYISLGTSAVKRGDIEKASTYRDYAEQLVPRNTELPVLREKIKQLRATMLDKEFVKEEVANLISVARNDIANSEGFSDSAYTKLQQVLRLQPENIEVKNLRNSMLEKLFSDTEKDIARGRVGSASEKVKLLQLYYHDPVKVATLDASLNNKSSSLARRNKLASLKKRAKSLTREKRSVTVNDELRDIYLSILKIDRLDKTALDGLTDTSDHEAKLARDAIQERNFERAERQISVIEQYTPRYKVVNELKSELRQARSSSQQAADLLVQANTKMQSTTSGDEKRLALADAYNKIERARDLDAAHPNMTESITALEDAYIAEIKLAIEAKDKDLIAAYNIDTETKAWPSERIFQLKQLAQKKDKKPKRVITGGF
ncbi:MAG: serine/threonine protein kinase [Agarilytica sp.]